MHLVSFQGVRSLGGGPLGGSDPGEIRIERGQDVIWSAEELLAPVANGRTLDDLGLQPGDRIILPVDADDGLSPVQQVVRDALFILVPLVLGVSLR